MVDSCPKTKDEYTLELQNKIKFYEERYLETFSELSDKLGHDAYLLDHLISNVRAFEQYRGFYVINKKQ